MSISKKTRLFICTLLLIVLAASSAFAGVTISLEEIPYSFNSHMGNGNAFLSHTDEGRGVLMDLNGQPVNGDAYDIYSNLVGKGFMVHDGKKVGLLWEDGRLILPCLYSDVQACSDDWAVGKNTDTSQFDICCKGSIVAHLDFDLIGENPHFKAYGDYLYTSTPNYQYVVSVDRNGNVRQSEGMSAFDEYYHDYRTDLFYHPGSGQTAFTATCSLQPDEVECPYLATYNGILDLQGNLISVYPEGVIFQSARGIPFRDYYEIEKDGKKGLINSRGEVVLEPIYDKIAGEVKALGLFLVRKDSQIMYVDHRGTIVQSISYNGSTSDIDGWGDGSSFLIFDTMNGKVVFTAGAGQVPQVFAGDYRFNYYPNRQFVIEVTWITSDGLLYGLMDANGNMLLPFTDKKVSVNDSETIVDYDSGRLLYKVIVTEN